MKETLLAFYLSLTLCQAQNSRFYQYTNLDYYEIQEETDNLKSLKQCCIHCTQGHCCEGAIYEGQVCKLLQNVQLSKNQSQTQAWIDSDILSRALITDKVLLITGDPKEDSKVSELVDLKTQSSCLTNITFPIELKSAFGGQLSPTDLLMCGGSTEGIPITDCFHVNLQNGELTEMPNHMVEPRSSGGYLVIKDVGLWIIGGNINGTSSKSTMIANLANTVYGPDLPDTWSNMCTAKINETSFFIAGGKFAEDDSSKASYFYNINSATDFLNGVWVQGPDLLGIKFRPTCAAFGFHSKSYIMVVGGLLKRDWQWLPSEDFDILDLETLAWIQGQPLPFGLKLHQMVETEDNHFVILGGTGKRKTDVKDKILELKCGTSSPEECQWIEKQQTLLQARHTFLAFPVFMRCPCN